MAKNQQDILNKLKIDELNPMQIAAGHAIHSSSNVVLLSPTGSGKTLAFLLPLIHSIDTKCDEIQALILVPTRELALQIEQVAREMGTGLKINAVYGGQSGSRDRMALKHRPAILIGTPGRVADRLRRDDFSLKSLSTIVLDEFDKSLEIGFEKEMKEIIGTLPAIKKRVLTSATQKLAVPKFVGLENLTTVDFTGTANSELIVQKVIGNNKLNALIDLLHHIGDAQGIIFCNFKDTINEVSNQLTAHQISHGVFQGGMEQVDREEALIKLRNGTHNIIIATDLAARGIDVNDLKFIIHYELPPRETEYTHRNGRTARMNADGTAYLLFGDRQRIPDYIPSMEALNLTKQDFKGYTEWRTLLVSTGRQDKVSKGDIAGTFFKIGQLNKDELGIIEIKQTCAFVAVHHAKAKKVAASLNNAKIKKKKVRVRLI
ncbi:MAG: DEAD/DEAH box helicase [Cyclobacteriaceae bacterium]